MSNIPPGPSEELPDVDESIVASETRYEIEDGRLVYVPPAFEPHASLHAKLAAVLEAHRAPAYAVAVDMLTRTSRIDNIAPDASVYPSARNPATGGRHVEELAFEIASTESLGHAGKRAVKLITRGVRRVFAIDVERERALEWSTALGQWSILDLSASIEDRALAVPMPVAALVDAGRADDAIVAALRHKQHREFVAEREQGRAEGREQGREQGREEGRAEIRAEIVSALLSVLASRGFAPNSEQRARIDGERDLGRIAKWLGSAATCTDVDDLLSR